jgi:hypothetical protein
MIRRKPRIKYLTAKQAEVARMLQARETIPPSVQRKPKSKK